MVNTFESQKYLSKKRNDLYHWYTQYHSIHITQVMNHEITLRPRFQRLYCCAEIQRFLISRSGIWTCSKNAIEDVSG